MRPTRLRKPTFKYSRLLFCALCAFLGSVDVNAANDAVCSTASLINPNAEESDVPTKGGMGGTSKMAKGGMSGTGNADDGGIGGTSAPAKGGMGGTSTVANGGMSGTGITDGGLGGTNNPAKGGMGGTGDVIADGLLLPNSEGGVAIVGVVTGFASVCVNGMEVHYDRSTPVYDNGDVSSLSRLTVGQMVILKADEVNGSLRARSIGMVDAVIGNIDKIDFKNMQIEVLGQVVQLDQETMQQIKTLEPNTMVRVSGHRVDSGEIVATKLSLAGARKAASTFGVVTNIGKDGFEVNGTRINIENKSIFNRVRLGTEVFVGGEWNGKTIKPKHVAMQPIKNMLNNSQSMLVEGFVSLDGSNGVSIAGTEASFNKVKTSYKNIVNSTGKVVRVELRRDDKKDWVFQSLDERKGDVFNKRYRSRNDSDGESDDEEQDKKGLSPNGASAPVDKLNSGVSGGGDSSSNDFGSSNEPRTSVKKQTDAQSGRQKELAKQQEDLAKQQADLAKKQAKQQEDLAKQQADLAKKQAKQQEDFAKQQADLAKKQAK